MPTTGLSARAFRVLADRAPWIRRLRIAQRVFSDLRAGKHPISLDYPVHPAPRYGHGKPPHGLIYAALAEQASRYEQTISDFIPYGEQLRAIPLDRPEDPRDPFWKNGWVESLDAVSLYCVPCVYGSKRYVEIGSGNSTKFVNRAIRRNNLRTKIVSIDPHPRAEIDTLCDEVIRRPLEDMDLGVFDTLGAGDILMIDNSHRCFQNSDVTVVFLEVLPRLKPGVLIYIDDIYLPSDYPPEWGFRYYSEQYLLAVLLLADSHRYEVVLPCQFLATHARLTRVVEAFWDQVGLRTVGGIGNGFWMVVRNQARQEAVA
jgi:hypothetical protein